MRQPSETVTPPAELVGEVAAVVYADPSSGFGVVELRGEGEADGARASGPLADLAPGQPLRLLGRWKDHERYGPTFAAVAYEPAPPRDAEALRVFLASSRFPGVGDVLAGRLVDAFGLGLVDVVERDPQSLARVKGVSAALARRIAEAWAEAGALSVLVRRLAAAGLPSWLAQAAHRRFGETAAEMLEADPYALLAVRGAGWEHAERLARSAGVARDDPRRLAAAPAAALRGVAAREGHVGLPGEELVAACRRLLGCDDATGRKALEAARRRGAVVEDLGLCYVAEDRHAEQGLADELLRLVTARSRVASSGARVTPDEGLTAEQTEAVRRALDHGLSVLTGGPGTGKTTTVRALVAAAASADLRLALCAPTGRAAKRLEELTGAGATTIHRLLDARPAGDDEGFAFGYDRTKRLPHDLVVADEWSMADTRLAWALAQAVESGAHLVCVGDADQLPSVGPGAVLRDLLDERLGAPARPLVAATRLTRVHRQAATSRIITLAHEIDAGTVSAPRGRDGDVFAVPERSDRVAARVAEIVAVRAPEFFDRSPSDVQVLAPMYRGPAGVDALNAALKARLNPGGGRPAVGGFHEGDRVVATRNDAEFDVANGDLGEVVRTDPRGRSVAVAFPHGVVELPADRLDDLRPGWCLTVHKAQGGQWPVVVLVLDPAHRAMLWREVLYTAVTRAEEGLLLVGDPRLVPAAARRSGRGSAGRHTRLVERLHAGYTCDDGGDAADIMGDDDAAEDRTPREVT